MSYDQKIEVIWFHLFFKTKSKIPYFPAERMALPLQEHQGDVTKFLELIDVDLSNRCKMFYFMLCSRSSIGGLQARILLFDALRSEFQKVVMKMTWDVPGQIARRQWTLILSFTEDNWAKMVATTQRREVVFECLFKNCGRDPKFAPIFNFPSLSDKIQEYVIRSEDFIHDNRIQFRRGGIKINIKEDGRRVMLVRLEERGFYQTCNYTVVDA